MKMKNIILKIVLALSVAWIFYYVVNYFAIYNWNNSESLIVKLIEAGPERVLPPDEDFGDSYEILEREVVLQVLSGAKGQGGLLTVKVVRLSGSGLELVTGRNYLLVWDKFDDGTLQYSISDAFRIP